MFFYSDKYTSSGNEVTGAVCFCVRVSVCVSTNVCIECLALWDRTGSVCCAWLRAEHQEQPAVYTVYGQRLHVEEKCFTTPGQITLNIHTLLIPLPVYQEHRSAAPFPPQSVSIFLSIHTSTPSNPPFFSLSLSLCLPSAQSHHTGSLFLANLSLIHYWDLFFFLESQNEEGERIFWIFNAPHEKCSISHFSAIRTGKLLAGHNTPSHEMMRDKERK